MSAEKPEPNPMEEVKITRREFANIENGIRIAVKAAILFLALRGRINDSTKNVSEDLRKI